METLPFRESHPARLLGTDATGNVWDVVVIRAGLSKNGNFYPEEVLKAAIPLFENVRACAYLFGDRLDHLPEQAAQQRPGGFAENVVGWFDKVRFGEFAESDGTKSRGLLAKFHLLPGADSLRKNMVEAFKQGRSDLYEFSIDAHGPASERDFEGKRVRWVEKINEVSSTDVVSQGAAGGKVLRLAASYGGETVGDLLSLLRECRPQWLQAFTEPDEGADLQDYALRVLEHNLAEAEGVQRDTPIHATQHLTEIARGVKTLEAAIEMIRTGKIAEAVRLLRNWIVEYPVPERRPVESQQRGLYSFPFNAQKSGEPVLGGPQSQIVQETQTVENTATKPAQEADSTIEASEPKGEVMEKEKELARREADLRVREAKLDIEQALTESELPDAAKERLRNELVALAEASDLPAEKIKERVASEMAYLKEVGVAKQESVAAPPPSAKLKNLGGAHDEPAKLQIGDGEKETWSKAWEGFFNGGEMVDGVRPISSLHEAFGQIMAPYVRRYISPQEMASTIMEFVALAVPRQPSILMETHIDRLREGWSSIPKTQRFREAITTSTHPVAFGDALFRVLQKEYRADPLNDWRRIISRTENLRDATSDVNIVRIGATPILPVVNENAPYQEVTTDPSENNEKLSPDKRGFLLKFTWEDALADRLGVLRQVPRKLGRSSARTIQQIIWDLIDTNPNLADGNALISAAHLNLVSGNPALAYADVTTAIQLLRDQTEQDSGEKLGLSPKYLLVGPAKENEAIEITDSSVKVNTAEDATVRSFVNRIGVQTFASIGLGRAAAPAPTSWYVMADPRDAETIVVGFLGGRDQPDIFAQTPMDTPTSGAAFDADALTFKVRLVVGAALADHRWISGSRATS